MTMIEMFYVFGAIGLFVIWAFSFANTMVYGRITTEIIDLSGYELNIFNSDLISHPNSGALEYIGIHSGIFTKYHYSRGVGKSNRQVLRWSKAHRNLEIKYNELRIEEWEEIKVEVNYKEIK